MLLFRRFCRRTHQQLWFFYRLLTLSIVDVWVGLTWRQGSFQKLLRLQCFKTKTMSIFNSRFCGPENEPIFWAQKLVRFLVSSRFSLISCPRSVHFLGSILGFSGPDFLFSEATVIASSLRASTGFYCDDRFLLGLFKRVLCSWCHCHCPRLIHPCSWCFLFHFLACRNIKCPATIIGKSEIIIITIAMVFLHNYRSPIFSFSTCLQPGGACPALG